VASYTLSGHGTQALTAGTGAIHWHVNTFPSRAGQGQAFPINYFDVGLLRAGDGTGFFPARPVDALDGWMGLPVGTTTLGYSLFGSTVVVVTEVAGTSPLVTPTPSLEQLTDVSVASVTDGDLLTWVASASKWENKPPAAPPSQTFQNLALAADVTISTQNTFTDLISFTLAAGTWIVWGTIMFQNATVLQIAVWRIITGSTVSFSGDNVMATGSQDYQGSILTVLQPASSTTYKLQAAINSNNAVVVKKNTRSGDLWASQPNATGLVALKLF